MQSLKERKLELAKTVREAAQKQEPVSRAIIELVKLTIDDIKESLVSAEREDIHRLQGAARELRRLYRELTTDSPSVAPTGA